MLIRVGHLQFFSVITVTLLLQACSVSSIKPSQTETKTLAVEEKPPQQTPLLTLRFAAVGDVMIGTDFPKNTLPDDDGLNFLKHATPLLQSVDVALGNLEGVLQDGGDPIKQCKNPKVCYLFRSPTRYAKHFASAGFSVMNLANNHACDFGEDGRTKTMLALDNVGIAHTGRVGDIARVTAKNRAIAIIGFAPNFGAYQLNNLIEARKQVAALVAENQLVVVMFHGGAEGAGAERLSFEHEFYEGEDRGNLVEFAHALIDEGADLVMGSGPHVPRAIELYKNRLIAYSLGNFATHYGISVAGNNSLAPLITAQLNSDGEFLDAHLHSFVQRRPDGPIIDEAFSALTLIKQLSLDAFPDGQLQFNDDGSIVKIQRQTSEIKANTSP